jgi:hypothetical protein
MGVRRFATLLVVLAAAAWAHDADVLYATVKQTGDQGQLSEIVTLTGATLGLLAPIDADGDGALSQADLDAKTKALEVGVWDEMPLTSGGQPCGRERVSATLREGFVQLEGHFRCQAGELRQDFRLLRVLPANYRVVLGSQLDGEGRARGFAQGSMTAITIPRPAAPGSWDGAQFRGAFDDGVARGLSLLAIGAGFAVWLTMGAWRRGLAAWGLLLAALAVGSWFQAPPLAPAAILLLGAIGVAVSARPPLVLALIVGGALGALGGGDGWVSALGVAAGSLVVLAPLGVVAIALGVMLKRRPRALKVVRWLPAVCVLVGVARLSW